MYARFPLLMIVAVAMSLFSSCSKSEDSDDSDLAFDDRNLFIRFIYKIGDDYLEPDSVYLNNFAQKYQVTAISCLVSDFYLFDGLDTIVAGNNYAKATLSNPEVAIAKVNSGSYSGAYRFNIGLNSVVNQTNPSNYSSGHTLSDRSIYFDAARGYKFLVIEGVAAAAGDENLTVPFSYHVGTDALLSDFSDTKSFGVGTNRNAVFNVELNIGTLLNSLDIVSNPSTQSTNNAADFAVAQGIHTRLQQAVVLL